MKQIKAIVGLSTTQCIQREVYGEFLISYDFSFIFFFLKFVFYILFFFFALLCCSVLLTWAHNFSSFVLKKKCVSEWVRWKKGRKNEQNIYLLYCCLWKVEVLNSNGNSKAPISFFFYKLPNVKVWVFATWMSVCSCVNVCVWSVGFFF